MNDFFAGTGLLKAFTMVRQVKCFTALVLLAATGVSVATADLVPPSETRRPTERGQAAPASCQLVPVPAAASECEENPTATRAIQGLPESPGSGRLFLWALGSLGAWQLARSARRMDVLAVVPDWYHAGGRRQVGHTFAFDLSCAIVDSPTLVPEMVCGDVVCACDARIVYRHLLPAVAPRGPPFRSF